MRGLKELQNFDKNANFDGFNSRHFSSDRAFKATTIKLNVSMYLTKNS